MKIVRGDSCLRIDTGEDFGTDGVVNETLGLINSRNAFNLSAYLDQRVMLVDRTCVCAGAAATRVGPGSYSNPC